MPFQSRINYAISAANSALNQLYGYNNYAHPRSEPNASIRNNARLTLDPLTSEIGRAVQEGRWEGVSGSSARQALRAKEMISAATWSLSDQPEMGRPTNVPLAQRQIRDAIDMLHRARW